MELLGLSLLFWASCMMLKSNIDMGKEERLPWQKHLDKPPF